MYIDNKIFDIKKNKKIKNFVLIDDNKKNFNNSDLTKVISKGKRVVKLFKSNKLNKMNSTAPGIYGFSKYQIHQHIKITKKKLKQGNFNEGFIEPINDLIKKGSKFNTLKLNRYVSWRNINSIKDLNVIKK